MVLFKELFEFVGISSENISRNNSSMVFHDGNDRKFLPEILPTLNEEFAIIYDRVQKFQ